MKRRKAGGENAAADENLCNRLVEELADVLMYDNDVLLCYRIDAEELKRAYTEKFEKNMMRWQRKRPRQDELPRALCCLDGFNRRNGWGLHSGRFGGRQSAGARWTRTPEARLRRQSRWYLPR